MAEERGCCRGSPYGWRCSKSNWESGIVPRSYPDCFPDIPVLALNVGEHVGACRACLGSFQERSHFAHISFGLFRRQLMLASFTVGSGRNVHFFGTARSRTHAPPRFYPTPSRDSGECPVAVAAAVRVVARNRHCPSASHSPSISSI